MKKTLLICILQAFVYSLYAQSTDVQGLKSASSAAALVNYNNTGFYENKGQFYDQAHNPNPGVKYLYHSPGFNVQLRQTGFSYDTYIDSIDVAKTEARKQRSISLHRKRINMLPIVNLRYHRVDIELQGCNTNAQITTEGKSATYYNYYTANVEQQGATDVHYYQKVVYTDIYPHIDLEFLAPSLQTSPNGTPEYNFIIHPGGNPADIKLAYKGANNIALKDNKLVVSVTSGDFTESIPASYFKDTKQAIEVNYKDLGNNVYAFSLPPNTELKSDLVIDPTGSGLAKLQWGTYIGNQTDATQCNATDVDVNDNPYVTGATGSTTLIASAGTFKTSLTAGDGSTLVMKLNSSGTALDWGTYIGALAGDGTGNNEEGSDLKLDASGNVYVTGLTETAGLGTAGTYNSTINGTGDAYVCKLTTTGTMGWFTYYAGTTKDDGIWDEGFGLTLDASDNVYVVGCTEGTTKVASGSAYQSANACANYPGIPNAFVAKFTSLGALTWGTYFGGPGGCVANGVGVDAAGNVYFGGTAYDSLCKTTMLQGIPAPAAGSFQTRPHGGVTVNDGVAVTGFIAKLNSLGSALDWDTYIGGSTGNDQGEDLVVDAYGNVFFVGDYNSSGFGTSGSYQSINDRLTVTKTSLVATLTVTTYGDQGFVAKFTSAGAMSWGTFIGGEAWGVDLGKSDTVYVSGEYKTLNGPTVATAGSYQTTCAGGPLDAFVCILSPDGSTLVAGTYYGGTQEEYCQMGMHVDTTSTPNQDIVYIAGQTASTTQIATAGVYQPSYGSDTYYEGFLAKFDYDNPVVVTPITLLYFSCAPSSIGNGFDLTWATASETNNKYFTIERSSDGTNFYPITTISGAGNSVFTKTYEYTDLNPLSGMNYYRLSQTDNFGTTVQDNVSACDEEDSVLVYPNPASGVFAIKLPTKDISSPTTIALYDLLGQKILSQTVQNQPIINIGIPNLAASIYLVKITTADNAYTIKLIVKK